MGPLFLVYSSYNAVQYTYFQSHILFSGVGELSISYLLLIALYLSMLKNCYFLPILVHLERKSCT